MAAALAGIRIADWVIDLGPDSGDKGGQAVAAGTPEAVAKVAASWTGGVGVAFRRC